MKVFIDKYEGLSEDKINTLKQFHSHYKIHGIIQLPVSLKYVMQILMEITSARWTTCLCNNSQQQMYSKVFFKLIDRIFSDFGVKNNTNNE